MWACTGEVWAAFVFADFGLHVALCLCSGGALLNRLTHPGFNLKIPYLDL